MTGITDKELIEALDGLLFKHDLGKVTDEDVILELKRLIVIPHKPDPSSMADYQRAAHRTAEYPELSKIDYLILGLVSEAGEIASLRKKLIRGDELPPGPSWTDLVADELGDVLWYVSELALAMNLNLYWIADSNLKKLARRAENGTIKGSGDNR
jgi:NTP pyrophosphatase (non-canonical NTP hydrolase)